MIDFIDYLNYSNCYIDDNVIDFVNRNKYKIISREEVDKFLDSIGCSYNELSIFSKKKINELEVF